ncbi:MAG: hypothetical protein ABI743_04320 [bacterium]
MRPVMTILGLSALSLLLAGPVAAEKNHRDHGPGDDGHHPQNQPMDEQFGGPMGPGGGCPMGFGMGPDDGPMGPHGPMMDKRHRRGGGAFALNQDDWELVNELPARINEADYAWHPNRLRQAAIDFITNDVYRLSILPFHDVSQSGPLENDLDPSWSERVMRDTLAGSLLETGILVLPAENTEAALVELKGYSGDMNPLDASGFTRGIMMTNSLNQGSYSTQLTDEATKRVGQYSDRMGFGNSNKASFSTLNNDLTPQEFRDLGDALDVDGFLIGSITHLGNSGGSSNFIDQLFDGESSKLAATFYLVDAATGEPIYGKRIVVEDKESWWDLDSDDTSIDALSNEFAGAVMRDLTHPVPMWYVQELRHRYGLEKDPPRKHLYGEVKPRHVDANLGEWRDPTHAQQKVDEYRPGKHHGKKAKGKHHDDNDESGDDDHGRDDDDRDEGDDDDEREPGQHLEVAGD